MGTLRIQLSGVASIAKSRLEMGVPSDVVSKVRVVAATHSHCQ